MKNKTLFAIIAIAGVIGTTAFVSTMVSARGFGFGQSLENEAQFLGMSPEELQAQLEVKTLPEILDEQGVTHTQFYEQRQQLQLKRQAEMLGMTTEELSAELGNKTFAEYLDEQGITHTELMQKRQEQMKADMTERLQSLVDDETITEEQMQSRLQMMEDRSVGTPWHGHAEHGGRMGGLMF